MFRWYTNEIKYNLKDKPDVSESSISSHVRISYRFNQFVTTRYTTNFYIINSSIQGPSAIKCVQSMRHEASDSGSIYALLLLLCRHIGLLRLDTNLLRHRIRKYPDSPVHTLPDLLRIYFFLLWRADSKNTRIRVNRAWGSCGDLNSR